MIQSMLGVDKSEFLYWSVFMDRSQWKISQWQVKKNSMINQKNNDKECFKWTVIAALYNQRLLRILKANQK